MMRKLNVILLMLALAWPAGAVEFGHPPGSGTGGGGGIVSNTATPLAFDVNYDATHGIYTNNTDWYADVRAVLSMSGTNYVDVYTTNSALTRFEFTPYFFNPLLFGSVVVSNTVRFTVPPRGSYAVKTNGLLSAIATGRQQTISYMATNGSSSGGSSGVSAAEVAAIMATNNAQELVNTAMPRFPMGAWSTKWEVVAEVLRTNQTYDAGGLRVPTMYYDKNMIRVYYAGYTNAILGGGLNKGCIIGAFGTSWDSITKYGPVISPTPGSWDSRNIGGGRIFSFDESGTNYFYYFGSTNTVFEVGRQELGVAYTTDGTNFTKYSGNPILSPSVSGWDSASIQGGVHVIKWNGLFYMFYGGKNGTPEFIGMATANSPLGPWTKYSGNPVLTNAALIVAEPNVFRLEDQTGWGMITGQGAATSTDLTNWTYTTTIEPTCPANVRNIQSPLLSPFVFSDGGMCSLWDNTVQIFLVRPTRSQPAGFYSGQFSGEGIGITNVSADALQRYAATTTNSFNITGAISVTNTTWYWNNSLLVYTNASLANAAIVYASSNYSGFDINSFIYTNAAHHDIPGFDIAGFVSYLPPSRQGIQWYDSTFTTDGLLYYGPPLTDGLRLDATVTNNQANVNFTNLTATGTTTLSNVNVSGTITAPNLIVTNLVIASAASVTVTVKSGSGSPESAVTAPVGSLYLRTDGGYTTTFYVKTNGSGNTGWGAK